jgi:hypothetical protein
MFTIPVDSGYCLVTARGARALGGLAGRRSRPGPTFLHSAIHEKGLFCIPPEKQVGWSTEIGAKGRHNLVAQALFAYKTLHIRMFPRSPELLRSWAARLRKK